MKEVVVTTSWDDGHKLDVRLAELLKKYDIKGTFYIAPKDWEFPRDELLTDQQIKDISKSFEIGAHTITHRSLPALPHTEARREIVDSKSYLENVTGQEVASFCYPRGEYEPKHVEMVRKAGYAYARTVNRHSFTIGKSQLEALTTIHTYNHYSDLWKIAKFAHFDPIKTFQYFQWDVLAKAMFDQVLETGGVFHLWGHSWEIEKHKDWKKLEEVLAYISRKQNVMYVTNEELKITEPSNVLITIPYFPPYLGGTQMYAYNIAKRLQKDFDWNVCVATSGIQGFNSYTKEAYENLVVYRLSYWFKISNTPINLFWPFMLKEIIKNEKISVINAHAPVPFMADVTAAVANKIPFILTYHTGSMNKIGGKLTNIVIAIYENTFLRYLLKRANFIVCPSDFVRFGFLKPYAWKSRTITPGVDSDVFKPAPRKDNTPTILFVGGLTRSEQHKGLHVLINSFAQICKNYPKLQLLVAGEGNMRPEYESKVRDLGLSDRIIFTGRLSMEGLAEKYQQCDVFVLPSLAPAESFGMVLVEAMATGKPVIGSIAGGIPLVVDHEQNGLLVRSNDVNALADGLKRLLDDQSLREKLGAAGLQKTKDQYNWMSKSKSYDKLFQIALEKRPTIAQLVGYYPPHIGGMEMVAQEISAELTRQNYQVKVFTSNIGAEESAQEYDYQIFRMKTTEFAHTPIMWMLPFRLLALPKNSILHVHISQALIPEIAYIVAKLRGFKLVTHFHLDVGPSGRVGIILPLYKKCFLGPIMQGSDKVIVFSSEQLETLRKLYRIPESKIAVIPNGVGKEFFNEEIKTPLHKELRVLYVGRLSIQKHVDRIINAISLLTVPAHLTIVGDGEYRTKLETLAWDLHLTNISFEGKKYGPELREYYRTSDVFVIASDIEGMPLVVLEAMASALPIVGSNVPGTRELVNGVGVLVNEPYETGFADALTSLALNHKELVEASARSLNKANEFSWESLIEKLEKVYKEIQS